MSRFLYPEIPRGLIVPIDHGLTMGPLSGIRHVREIGTWITHPAITGVIAHKGMAERLVEAGFLAGKGLMIHLNGMSTLGAKPDDKVLLTSVEAALRLGADAVSVQVNFDGSNDAANLRLLGSVVDEANQAAVPVLAMVYDKVKTGTDQSTERINHLIRISLELGCEAIKIGAPLHLQKVIQSASQDLRVFIAGGNMAEDDALYALTRQVVRAGGSGLCVGRNVFQKENSNSVLSSLKKILLEGTGTVSELPRHREELYGIH